MTIPNINNIDISKLSISEVKHIVNDLVKARDANNCNDFVQLCKNDKRSGVNKLGERLSAEINARKAEIKRVDKLYAFEDSIAGIPGSVILGLDEVGRGPLAGPLTVGGVILPRNPKILNINDSKKLSASQRDEIAKEIYSVARFAHTEFVEPNKIDAHGMTECLRYAFSEIVRRATDEGFKIDVILLDGNPMHIDSREVNVIKGDAKSASIGCASIIAKVTRDDYMEKISSRYPKYCFAQNKGYGTANHIEAIKKYGLTPVHRKSFCTSFMQMSLF